MRAYFQILAILLDNQKLIADISQYITPDASKTKQKNVDELIKNFSPPRRLMFIMYGEMVCAQEMRKIKNKTTRMLCVNNVMYNSSWDKVIEKYCAMHHLLWSWFFIILLFKKKLLLFFRNSYENLYFVVTLKCALNQHYHCRWCNWTLISVFLRLSPYLSCLLNIINVHRLSGWLRIIYQLCERGTGYIILG